MANLERLREEGVKIAVSELAASIAGLSMVRAFPVDLVRLDFRGIKSLTGVQRLNQMLTLFLQLATTVETPVILTGIDTEEDLEAARSAGAEQVQGSFAGTRLCALQASQFSTSLATRVRTKPAAPELLKLA